MKKYNLFLFLIQFWAAINTIKCNRVILYLSMTNVR